MMENNNRLCVLVNPHDLVSISICFSFFPLFRTLTKGCFVNWVVSQRCVECCYCVTSRTWRKVYTRWSSLQSMSSHSPSSICFSRNYVHFGLSQFEHFPIINQRRIRKYYKLNGGECSEKFFCLCVVILRTLSNLQD